MDDYWRDFVQESEEHITELNNSLLALERSPTDDEAMEAIFRTAHTLKGNCGAMGLTRASELAHAIEDLLDAVRTGRVDVSSSLMDTIFDGVDELEAMIDEVARYQEIRRDPEPTIESLRAPLDEAGGREERDGDTRDSSASASASMVIQTDEELDAVLSRFDPPTDPDHDVFFVRLSINESSTVGDETGTASVDVNNGILVVDALIDAFDLLGTDPPRETIESGSYSGTFDAVFGSAVGETAIATALEPVDAVDEFEILTVTERFEEVHASRSEESSDEPDVESGLEVTPDDAEEMSVDELLDEFEEFDDLDAMVEEIDDVSAFDDMGDAGSFHELLDDDALDSSAASGPDSAETGQEAPLEDSDGEEQDEDADDEVDDADAVFAELKSEVEMVGFDELQEELDELEFDEFDSDDEVDMDELLGDDVDIADNSFLEVSEDDFEKDVEDALVDETSQFSDDESSRDGDRTEPVDGTDTDEGQTADAIDPDDEIVADDEAFEAFAFDEGNLEDETDVEADAERYEHDDDFLDDLSALGSVDFGEPDDGTDGVDADFDAPADLDDSDDGDESDEPVESGVRTGEGRDDADDLAEPAMESSEPTGATASDGVRAEDAALEEDGDDLDADTPDEVDDLDDPLGTGESGESRDHDNAEDDGTFTPPEADVEDGFAAEADLDEDALGDSFSGDVESDVGAFDPDEADFGDDGAAETTAAVEPESESEPDLEPEDDFEYDSEITGGSFEEPTKAFDLGGGDDEPVDVDSGGSVETDSVADDGPATDDPASAHSSSGDALEPTSTEASSSVLDGIEASDGTGFGGPDGLEIPDITVPEDQHRPETGHQTDEIQSVRVDVEQIDSLLTLVEGLVTSRVRLRHALESGEDFASIDRELDDLEDLTSELQTTVMDVRLVPLHTVANRLPRVVRDIARDQDKEAVFEQSGENVELDRSILDRIGDPLIHLVRNAVDHGIEPPAEREAIDKPREGTVELRADRSRDRVTIEIEDDGRGLDPDQLRSAAVDSGVLSEAEVADLDDEEVLELVFHPGLTTAKEVTDVSGRGVGMDVVRRTVEELDGTVSIDSEPNEGTTITMTLPVTVAIADVLFVESGGEEFGIPLKVVQDIEDARTVETVDERPVLTENDREVPIVDIAEALDSPGGKSNGDGMIVRVRDDVRTVGLHCSEVRERQEVVVTPFEGFMSGIPGLSGATVRGRGEVVNILDVSTL